MIIRRRSKFYENPKCSYVYNKCVNGNRADLSTVTINGKNSLSGKFYFCCSNCWYKLFCRNQKIGSSNLFNSGLVLYNFYLCAVSNNGIAVLKLTCATNVKTD